MLYLSGVRLLHVHRSPLSALWAMMEKYMIFTFYHEQVDPGTSKMTMEMSKCIV